MLYLNVWEQEKAEAASLWDKSRWAELETYILKSLDAGQRSKLKLKNPLGIAHNLLNKYKGTYSPALPLVPYCIFFKNKSFYIRISRFVFCFLFFG